MKYSTSFKNSKNHKYNDLQIFITKEDTQMKNYMKIIGACALLGLSVNASAQCPATPAAWDVTNTTNGASLAITAGGAASTTCKLTITQGPNNNGIATVRDDLATPETRYRARFYVDVTNLMSTATGAAHRFKAFVAGNATNKVPPSVDTKARPAIMQMFLVGLGSNQARLGGFCRDLNSNGNRAKFGSGTNPGNVNLQTGWNVVEVEMVIGAGTGACRIWVNNNTEASPDWEQTGIDNALLVGVEKANLGSTGSTQAYADVVGAQEVHFDEFESRRQTFIGSM